MWIPVWLAVGIGGYFSLRFEPTVGQNIAIALFAVICLFSALKWQSMWRALIWIPVLISLGFLVASYRSHWVSAPKLGWHFYGAVEGTIAHLDRSTSDKPRITLTAPRLERIPLARTPQRLRISLHSPILGTELRPGARIQLTASLSPPAGPVEPGGFDFQRKAWFQRLGGVGYSRVPVMLAHPPKGGGFILYLFALRMKVADSIRSAIQGQPGAFAAAIVTGDRSVIDPKMMQNLRRSNLAHLLAISGLHMGLLTGFIFALIRYSLALVPPIALRLPTKKIAAVLALMAGLAYLLVSGANVATQRAYVMVLVMLIAVLVDQPAITLRAVAVAAILILLSRPESLIEPGFQMSFAATTALVATFEALRRAPFWARLQSGRVRILRPVLALVMSSAVAGAATAPISAFHFNQITHYGLLANLASVPVMGLIVMPAAVIAGVLSLFGAATPAFLVMGGGIQWILSVATAVAGMKGALTQIPATASATLALLCLSMIFVALWKGRLRLLGLLPAAFAFLLWTQSERPDILITDNGRLVGVRQGGGRALNRAKGNGFAARAWLENDADAVDQSQAALRRKFNADDWLLMIGSSKISYLWPKSTPISVLEQKCANTDVLIAPNNTAKLSGDCRIISKIMLQDQGAISLSSRKGRLKIQSARQWTGERLWNQ
ncbi:MAG: ComEC family competence protein [Rhodobacteraceae bacterium]|nr:ComEC family competence protein [Paracoccaceae bacterium]